MRMRGGLIVYVTSHGFGHLNRSAAVINQMASEIPVTIRCDRNLFAHWRERLRRPAELTEYVSDAGAINPPGNSAATDGPATLERASQVHLKAAGLIAEEVAWLRNTGAAAVLCDAPPLPLLAAKEAGIAGFLLANFTWTEIYAPHAKRLGTDARDLVAEIRTEYRSAVEVFRAQPGLKLADFDVHKITDVGMVVTPGRDRRPELDRLLGLNPSDKLVYFYVGRYGQSNLGWQRLEGLKAHGTHFVGFHPAPSGKVSNLHVVPAREWTGADLAASSDVIVAKAGYGTVCEAMVAGTPMIYPPRTGFAEHRALDRALKTWGGGVPASVREFSELRIERHLEKAFALRPGRPPFPADGAARIATRLTLACEAVRMQIKLFPEPSKP